MCMRLTNVGSQYLIANVDPDGEPFDGAKTYRLRLPQGHPGGPVLVTHRLRQPDPLHAADRRSATRGPAARAIPPRQPKPSRTAPPSSTSRRPGRTASRPGNWIQTDPDRGWFVVLRLYSPLQPFFDKTWRPGEFEPVA